MRRPAAPAPGLDPRIARLPSTTFYGQRLTRRQIGDIQETVGLLPQLSRTELGHTICEHLGWQTPRGTNRIQLAMRVLGGTGAARDPDPAGQAGPRARPPAAAAPGPAQRAPGPDRGPAGPASSRSACGSCGERPQAALWE